MFISSTFHYMHAERDYLVKFIFMQLSKLFESRGVSWSELDMRWDDTDDQKINGNLRSIFIEEIKCCLM